MDSQTTELAKPTTSSVNNAPGVEWQPNPIVPTPIENIRPTPAFHGLNNSEVKPEMKPVEAPPKPNIASSEVFANPVAQTFPTVETQNITPSPVVSEAPNQASVLTPKTPEVNSGEQPKSNEENGLSVESNLIKENILGYVSLTLGREWKQSIEEDKEKGCPFERVIGDKTYTFWVSPENHQVILEINGKEFGRVGGITILDFKKGELVLSNGKDKYVISGDDHTYPKTGTETIKISDKNVTSVGPEPILGP